MQPQLPNGFPYSPTSGYGVAAAYGFGAAPGMMGMPQMWMDRAPAEASMGQAPYPGMMSTSYDGSPLQSYDPRWLQQQQQQQQQQQRRRQQLQQQQLLQQHGGQCEQELQKAQQQQQQQQSPGSSMHSLSAIHVPPGTHVLRTFNDGSLLVSDEHGTVRSMNQEELSWNASPMTNLSSASTSGLCSPTGQPTGYSPGVGSGGVRRESLGVGWQSPGYRGRQHLDGNGTAEMGDAAAMWRRFSRMGMEGEEGQAQRCHRGAGRTEAPALPPLSPMSVKWGKLALYAKDPEGSRGTPLHGCTVTPLHRYTITPLHRYTVTPSLHRLSQCYSTSFPPFPRMNWSAPASSSSLTCTSCRATCSATT